MKYKTTLQSVCMQTNTFSMLLVWSKVFVLFVELFPSIGALWVIGVCLYISGLPIQSNPIDPYLDNRQSNRNNQSIIYHRFFLIVLDCFWIDYSCFTFNFCLYF